MSLPPEYAMTATAAQINLAVDMVRRAFVDLKDYSATGDGTTDDSTAVQNAFDGAGVSIVVVTSGSYDLGGATITPPSGAKLFLAGGVLKNGTIAADGLDVVGTGGLASDITLTGVTRSAVEFDWFATERADIADYLTFINGSNATFGSAPSIGTANRVVLKMLIDNEHAVRFGAGIYPFDDEVEISSARDFRLIGVDRSNTLIWAPTSAFLHYTGGASADPYMRDLAVEADGPVLHTDAHAVGAIRDLRFRDCLLVSYSDHACYNDKTISSETECAIYGAKVENCAVHAGDGKAVFYNWSSGSGIFDKIEDAPVFYGGDGTVPKGTMQAIFWNSNVRHMSNCNIAYSAMDYVFYVDEYAQWVFSADSNVFETNATSFKAVVKDTASSYLDLDTRANQYIGAPTENGLHYISTGGNVRVKGTDSPTPIYSSSLQNYTSKFIQGVTEPVDAGGTKSRLVYMEPHTVKEDGTQFNSQLIALDADVAASAGFSDYYADNSATLSYLEVRPSARVAVGQRLADGSGTTANRPTNVLYDGLMYFDTTLGHAIWWDGTNWVDHAGTTV